MELHWIENDIQSHKEMCGFSESTNHDQWNVITQQIARGPFSWTNEEELIRLLLIYTYAKGNVLTFYMIGNGDFMPVCWCTKSNVFTVTIIWWYLLKHSPRKPFIVWNLNYLLMHRWPLQVESLICKSYHRLSVACGSDEEVRKPISR